MLCVLQLKELIKRIHSIIFLSVDDWIIKCRPMIKKTFDGKFWA